MGNKSKGVPRFNNKLQKDFDNRLMNLESSSFTGFLRAEALLDILVEKGIISKDEHSQRTVELYEESKQYYTKDNTETSTKVSASSSVMHDSLSSVISFLLIGMVCFHCFLN